MDNYRAKLKVTHFFYIVAIIVKSRELWKLHKTQTCECKRCKDIKIEFKWIKIKQWISQTHSITSAHLKLKYDDYIFSKRIKNLRNRRITKVNKTHPSRTKSCRNHVFTLVARLNAIREKCNIKP